jgi:transcriptional regulator with XRE-family HTH domain
MTIETIGELEQSLGRTIRELRIRKNLDQVTLAEQAGIALNAVKNLENGKGATLSSLLNVLKALDRIEWLSTLSPAVSISPIQALNSKSKRSRVGRPRKKKNV